MEYYAHSDKTKDQLQWHLLKDHLLDTAKIAGSFAEKFGAKQFGYTAGLLHDMGKYDPNFQKRLAGQKIGVDHSTPGAIEAVKKYSIYGLILAYVIAGHHSGLPDWGSRADEVSLEFRLQKPMNNYSAFRDEIEKYLLTEFEGLPKGLRPQGFSLQFFIRFIYSCLVDADFLDTERALNISRASARLNGNSLRTLKEKLDAFMDDFSVKAADTMVNRKRIDILNNCRDNADRSPGLFTLTVPTGGGKTLSSLSFALRHAVKHSMDRVIYVIPYTSIIEQNAEVFREILGEENILEHHSNFAYPEEKKLESESDFTSSVEQKLRLATENWDMPIITTTNVQFFESLFASRSSRCRKLHNIANSVIVVDEAQMLPTNFLKPCLRVLTELTTGYRSTVVLCTATQPAFSKLLPKDIRPVELAEAPDALYKSFKRVRVNNLGAVADDELAEKLKSHSQTLCIVNTKKHARLLFQAIDDGDGAFHLSTRMCPAHRTETLSKIREHLKSGKTCRVVSTQLIEAGVDVDFPVVYRSMAGIDSIAQSAGRCNREGLLPYEGKLYVFGPELHGMPKGWLNRTAALGRQVMEGVEDSLSLEAVHRYFSLLYDVEAEELDRERILADIKEQEKKLRFPFRSIAEKFKLIDDNNFTVLVQWEEDCRKILDCVMASHSPGYFVRKLQRYGVQVFEKEFDEMLAGGFLEVVANRYFVLREDVFKKYYSQMTGLEPFTESMKANDLLII